MQYSEDSVFDLDDPMIGQTLGHYRIKSRIAEGGMGVVYFAEHARLGRKVAIKLLKPAAAQRGDVVRRFFREAQAVHQIGHPNIVDVIDFVEERDCDPPRVYTVMEYLEGEDLAKRISLQPMNPAEVVEVACQAADALMATHEAQILHRDLKPENIFLCTTAEGKIHVKLLDFGVAKTFEEQAEESPRRTKLTDPGTTVGTPEYMAPEQVLGRHLDSRTDVYAMGLVIYKMLTGTTPFRAETYGEVLVSQVRDPPAPIGELRPEDLPPVPPALERVVMRCLEKRPDDRYNTIAELKVDLLTCLRRDRSNEVKTTYRGAAAAMRGDSEDPIVPGELGLPDPRMHRWIVGGVVLGAVVLIGAGLAWFFIAGARQSSRAVSAQERQAPQKLAATTTNTGLPHSTQPAAALVPDGGTSGTSHVSGNSLDAGAKNQAQAPTATSANVERASSAPAANPASENRGEAPPHAIIPPQRSVLSGAPRQNSEEQANPRKAGKKHVSSRTPGKRPHDLDETVNPFN